MSIVEKIIEIGYALQMRSRVADASLSTCGFMSESGRFVEQIGKTLRATGLTEAQLEGLAAGTHVVVPVEPTEAMLDVYRRAFISQDRFDGATVFRAMLAAKEG